MLHILVFLTYFVVFTTSVHAQSDSPAQITDILIVIRNIIRFLAPAAAIAFFVMAVWGGFKFIKSRGDPKNLEEARHIFQFAAIGAALVAGSWLILVLVGTLTGCDTTVISFDNC